jgi:hypothetical protein
MKAKPARGAAADPFAPTAVEWDALIAAAALLAGHATREARRHLVTNAGRFGVEAVAAIDAGNAPMQVRPILDAVLARYRA